ncbi:MAG: hypothetical protein PVH40_08975 [Gemmatimonadales bacterium]|jgi:hypothetical protein
MRAARGVLGLCALAVWAQPALAQGIDTRVAFFAERYKFDPGLVYNKIRQYTVPVGVTVPLGRRGHVALSTGYTAVELFSADKSQLTNQYVSGIIDTELRVGWNAVPGRLMLVATGAIPTGITAVQTTELSVLGALASDIIGFTAPAVGTGGGVGFGFAGAIPIGRWALGIGATAREAFRYEAVAGAKELKPGAEARVRVGLEGSLGPRTYIRLAGVLAHRRKDALGDSTVNGIGNRWVGHFSVNQGVENTLLVAYVFDVYRDNPQIEPTAVGAAVLPRGNLFGAGVNWVVPAWGLTFTPKTEFRYSRQAPLEGGGGLQRAGQSLRLGVDLRYPLARQLAIVAKGSWVTGYLVQGGEDVGFWGTRGSIHAEWRP